MTSGTLHVMGREGDIRKSWDVTRTAEVEDARRTFEEMRGKGYLAYRVDEEGGRGTTMHDFDPEAGAIIMTPQTVGG